MDEMKEKQGTGAAQEAATAAEQKTYTKEEVDALIQREADKRVTAAMKKAELTAERKKAEAVKEAERLAAMNADEKYHYELEQREKAIAEKEKQLALAENKAACTTILAEKNIPVQLVDFVVDADADVMKEKISTLDKYFKLAVKAEVEKRLAGNSPRKSTAASGEITKESFAKMKLAERNELFQNNPELYKQLINY